MSYVRGFRANIDMYSLDMVRMNMAWICSTILVCFVVMYASCEASIDISSIQYMGCFVDSIKAGKVLTAHTDTANTPSECIQKCRERQFNYAGVEYYSQCFCDNTLNDVKYSGNCYNKEATRCIHVNGYADQWCGGTNGISVYRVCPVGYGGPNCTEICKLDCGNRGCTVNSASSCTGSCLSGWKGVDKNCNTRCPSGFFGPDCIFNCSGRCLSSECDRRDGRCLQGCEPGLKGPYCMDSCPPGVNGTNCELCLHCQHGWCREDGWCRNKCVGGWTGDKCDVCPPDKWGFNCDKSCSPDCNCDIYNVYNGLCQSCVNGYYGDQCNKECPMYCLGGGCLKESGNCEECNPEYEGDKCCLPGCDTCERDGRVCVSCKSELYGDRCDNNCSAGCANKCDKHSGQCNPCEPNFYGDHCNISCTNCLNGLCFQNNGTCMDGCMSGHFGVDCNQTCPEKCENKVCKQWTGKCSACESPYHGLYCNQTCENSCGPNGCHMTNGSCFDCNDDKHGIYCQLPCPTNCEGGVCHRENGKCKNGCEDRYYGDNCTFSCPANCKTCKSDSECGPCNSGFHGAACDLPCSENCVGETCEKEGGHCTEASSTASTASPTASHTASPVSGDQPQSVGAAVGGSLAGLILIAVIVITVVLILLRRRRQDKSEQDHSDSIPLAPAPIVATVPPLKPEIKPKPKSQVSSTHSVMEPEETEEAADTCYENVMSATSVPLTVEELYAHIQTLEEEEDGESGFKKEFDSLSKGKLSPWTVAAMPVVMTKNRFKNIFPYDHSRVVLETVGDVEWSHYINASYIPGYRREKEFIASQGPTKHMCNDFLRMVFELQLPVIIMLTRLKEGLKTKCLQYWPPSGRGMFGDMEVTLLEETEKTHFVIRKLKIEKDGVCHAVTQLQYTSWPDHGVPRSPTHLINFREAALAHTEDTGGKPVLVHCSAGVGRTGTYIALDHQLRQAAAEGSVDVPACVNRLREARINMVQTEEQYELLYKALYEAIEVGNTTLTCDDAISLMADDGYREKITHQFEVLENFKPTFQLGDFLVARSKENVNKNRDANILPANHHRTMLMTAVPGRTDYINTVTVDGFVKRFEFYVTQLPLPDTVVDFWRLIMDYKCTRVVCLEQDQDTAWLPTEAQPLSQACFTVHLAPGHASSQPATLELCETVAAPDGLVYQNIDEVHKESDYMNVGTLSRGRPNKGKLLHSVQLYNGSINAPEEVCRLHQQLGNGEKEGDPIVVMCRDGASRCGVYVASHVLLDQVTSQQEADVFDAVRQVRATRPQLVNHVEQYDFLHRVIQTHLGITH